MKNVTFAIDRLRSSLATVSSRKLFAVLTLASALLYFAGLNARYLMDSDEPRVAGISTELMISGNWLEPHLNGKSFLEKPPLYFWADAMCIKIADQLGLEGPMAAKLPSAVSAFLGVLLLFWLLRAMRYSPLTCMLGGFFLATSAQYWRNGRKCIVDTFLCFFILVAMTAFYKIASTRKDDSQDLQPTLNKREKPHPTNHHHNITNACKHIVLVNFRQHMPNKKRKQIQSCFKKKKAGKHQTNINITL